MEIKGLTALVTGGASGLGGATVKRLAQHGANVVILDRDAEKGAALAAELGTNARFAQADVTSEEQVQAAINIAKDAFGALNVLVNCAGVAWRCGRPAATARIRWIFSRRSSASTSLGRSTASDWRQRR